MTQGLTEAASGQPEDPTSGAAYARPRDCYEQHPAESVLALRPRPPAPRTASCSRRVSGKRGAWRVAAGFWQHQDDQGLGGLGCVGGACARAAAGALPQYFDGIECLADCRPCSRDTSADARPSPGGLIRMVCETGTPDECAQSGVLSFRPKPARMSLRDWADVGALESAGCPVESAIPADPSSDTPWTPGRLSCVPGRIKLGAGLVPPAGVSRYVPGAEQRRFQSDRRYAAGASSS